MPATPRVSTRAAAVGVLLVVSLVFGAFFFAGPVAGLGASTLVLGLVVFLTAPTLAASAMLHPEACDDM